MASSYISLRRCFVCSLHLVRERGNCLVFVQVFVHQLVDFGTQVKALLLEVLEVLLIRFVARTLTGRNLELQLPDLFFQLLDVLKFQTHLVLQLLSVALLVLFDVVDLGLQ